MAIKWTPARVIDALGGNAEVAVLTGSGYNSVCNWRAQPHLPTRLFLVMSEILLRRGIYGVPPALWGMVQISDMPVRHPGYLPSSRRKPRRVVVDEAAAEVA